MTSICFHLSATNSACTSPIDRQEWRMGWTREGHRQAIRILQKTPTPSGTHQESQLYRCCPLREHHVGSERRSLRGACEITAPCEELVNRRADVLRVGHLV